MTTPSTPLHRAAAFEKGLELTREVLRELGFAEAAQAAQAESHLERDLGLHSLERLELIERVGAACAAASRSSASLIHSCTSLTALR